MKKRSNKKEITGKYRITVFDRDKNTLVKQYQLFYTLSKEEDIVKNHFRKNYNDMLPDGRYRVTSRNGLNEIYLLFYVDHI